MATWKGFAKITLADSTGLGFRHWVLSTAAGDTFSTAGSNKAIWELAAGASVTIYFRTGTSGTGIAPDAATDLNLSIYYETGFGTLVRRFHTGAAPADGTAFTIYGTHDGTVGGTPRAGVVQMFIGADRTGSAGGTNDYSVNTINGKVSGGSLVGAVTVNDMGAMRVSAIPASIVVSAYPAGATFAFGPAADEAFTTTLSMTRRYADANIETIRFDVINTGNAVVEAGASQESNAAADTNPASFVADLTYPQLAASYGVQVAVVGFSLLLPAERWTKFVTPGSGLTLPDILTVRRAAFFNVNPSLTPTLFTSKSNAVNANGVPTGEAENRFFVGADVCYFNTRIANARGEFVDNMAVSLSVFLAGSLEQGPFSGRVTETAASRLGWLDPSPYFYSVSVIAPAAQRTLTATYTRGSNTFQASVVVVFSPSYTGNLFIDLGVYRPSGSNDIRVVAVAIVLVDVDQVKLSQTTPPGILDQAPKAYLRTIPAQGVPVVVDTAAMLQVVSGSNDDWGCSFIGLDPTLNYSVSVAMQFNGGQVARAVPVPPVTNPDAGGDAQAGEPFAVEGGAEVGEFVWEEALSDAQIRSEALALKAIGGASAVFGEEESLEVLDNRPPDAFQVGRQYRLANAGKDGEGTYNILQKVPAPGDGGEKTRLTLGRIRTSVLGDMDRQEERIGKTERYL